MMWKNLDAFAKPREDVKTKSALGGIITIVASTAAVVLFIGQIYQYMMGATRHSLHLSKSHWVPVPKLGDFALRKGRIPLQIHMSFPSLECDSLDLRHDGVSSTDPIFKMIHGHHSSIQKRPMMASEWQEALGTVSSRADLAGSCCLTAHYDVPKVGGSFSVSLSRFAWGHALSYTMVGSGSMIIPHGKKRHSSVNVTHYIHSISFGDTSPFMEHNPMRNKLHVFDNPHGGIALSNIAVKLIPTRHSTILGSRDSYQLSVTDHVMEPETLLAQGIRYLPGLTVSYDFTALTVHVNENRESFLVFLSSLISIVGGVFVTVSLVTGVLVHSAAAVAKKLD